MPLSVNSRPHIPVPPARVFGWMGRHRFRACSRRLSKRWKNRLMVRDADAAGVNWAGLTHADGRAADTPVHLRGLADPDSGVRMRAVDHLRGTVVHQGTIFPATAPAVAEVCRLLADESVVSLPLRRRTPEEPGLVGAELLLFLADVAESAARGGTDQQLAARQCPPGLEGELARITAGDWEEDEFGSEPFLAAVAVVMDRAVLGCRAQAPAVVQAVWPWLGAPRRQIWQAAAAAQARWASLAGDPAVTAAVAQRMTAEASRAEDPRDRAAWVLALGNLGADTSAFLSDRAQLVRVCAALSASVADDPRSLREILAALDQLPDPGWWRPTGYLFIQGPWPDALIDAAITRARSFDQLLPVALCVATYAHPDLVEFDWGPLLRAAFPTPPAPGAPLPEAQRRYLAALADKDSLWHNNDMIGRGKFYLRELGLPTDRDEFRQLAANHNRAPHRRSD
jgi:hypothetical protein